MVTSADAPARVMRSTKGSSETASPTLAPCSQTSFPVGPGETRPAAPLGDAPRVFLAPPQPHGQKGAGERRPKRGERDDRR